MTSVNHVLAEALKTVQRPGDFYVSGVQDIYAPTISVEGVGPIALPLLPQQAAQLAAVAEQAPYGRGTETLVDTEVRRTWQIDPQRIRIDGRHWAANLQTIVSRCAIGLGVQGPVNAELYKMLVYDEGSFFLGHRDTEKAPGMFATLVLVLPSLYAGGELVIRHQDQEVHLELASQDAAEVAFAAFYADCWHEVRPITQGCRLALIYNLVRPGRGQLPKPPAYDAETEVLTTLLNVWRVQIDNDDEDAPKKLIYPLEHIYTPAEIGFGALKNADAAIAAVLGSAARRAGFELNLALVNIEESGSAEEVYYRARRSYYGSNADDYEMGEVYERNLSLSDLHAADDSPLPFQWLPFDEEELSPLDVFEDAEPDDVQFFGATGNEGATFARSYRRAALVLWPQERKLELLAAAGRRVSLPYLADRVARWQQAGADTPVAAELWREAHALGREVLACWPAPKAWNLRRDKACQLLDCLRQLQDRELIMTFIGVLSANGDYGNDDNAVLVPTLALLPPADAALAVQRIVVANAAPHPAACAALLRMISACDWVEPSGPTGDALRRAASALFAALQAHAAPAATGAIGSRPQGTPELVTDLLLALCGLQETALGAQFVSHVLQQPDAFPLDAVLVPAALQLAAQTAQRAWPAIRDLIAAGRDHLARRIAEPLEAPDDFARPSQLSCRCKYCTELAQFLADPERDEWLFKAVQAHRSHVESSIERDRCDVDTETLRHTSPHVLRCIKNQASYQRRVEQRQQDLQYHAQLLEP